MSTPEPDDILKAMAAQLDEIPEPQVVDYTKLSNVDLTEAFHEAHDQLIGIGQMDTGPDVESTTEGRELHSRRDAMIVEMSRRKM